jgi:hypothetical protein
MRDNAFIRSKLLDAFIPPLTFQQDSSPFQPKSNTKNTPAPQSTSITRQSYINLDENLQEDSLIIQQNEEPFLTTETSLIKKVGMSRAESSIISSQRKSNRKYLKVVSNPHEAITANSPRLSTRHTNVKKSNVFERKESSDWLSIDPPK